MTAYAMSTEAEKISPRSRLVSLGRHVVRAVVAVVCLLGLWRVPSAHAQDAGNFMEVFWEFRYSGGVNTVVGSRYDGERFYVSLGDLFGALQVNVIQEPSQNMAHGFYLQTSRPYEIDFNAGRMLMGNEEVRFDSTSWIREDLGYFLEVGLFEQLFDMSITLDERNLTMSMTTPDEMPVVAEARRQASRVVREDQTFLQRNAPLLFDRNRSIASGGVVGYRVSTELSGTSPRASLNLRGGGELLGGDLELGMNTNYSTSIAGQQDFSVGVDRWRWRYVARNMPALRQAQAGQLSSDGLRSFQYRGARISNDPVSVERFFGSYPMRIQSEPGWEVEMYLNNQLIDVRQTDATGVVNFSIPITFGSTSVTIREYGPSGEFRETERRIQVPFSFVPPGEIRYNLYAGQSLNGNRELVQATTSIGITSWLTAKWGFDYVTPDTSIEGEQLANLSWGSVSARIGPSYILTAHAAPGALYRASVNAFYPSLASLTLDFTQYQQNRIYNQSNRQHETRLTMNLPTQLGGLPITLRTSLSERLDAGNVYAFSGQQSISFNPGVLRFNVGFRGDARYIDSTFVPTTLRVEPRFGYSFGRGSAIPKPLRGLLVGLRSSFDLEDNSLTSLSANFSRRIGGSLRLQTDIGHQFDRDETTLTLRLSMDLNSIRTSTGARLRTADAPSFQQDVSGALSYDAGTRRLAVSDRDWVGRAAATIRMYVDYNGDGQRNEDEPLIENGGVSFRRAVSTQQADNGDILVYNLQAYEQYNLTVDQSRIRNPFWVPTMEEFSFITDPNVHKLIDIPFVVTGEVTGSVLRQTDNGLTAVPGMRLQIEQVDGDRTYEEPVFSDGTFYNLGMLPGTYEARVDSTQLAILGVTSDPPVHEFVVEATEAGDAVDGLDFVLRAPAAADAQPAEDEAPAAAEDDDVQPADVAETAAEPEAEPTAEATPTADDEVETTGDEEAQPVAEEAAPETAPDAEEEATPAQATVYIIQPGFEGLKELAELVYGDESLWPKIWLANTDQIDDPSEVTSGMQLVIPPQAPLTQVERSAGAGYEAQLEDGAAPQQGEGEDTPQPDAGEEQPGVGPQTGEAGIGSHTISPDDVSMMGLARQYYDNGALWPKIWVANYAAVPNPNAWEVGTTLVIPPAGPLTDVEREARDLYNAGDIDAVDELINTAPSDEDDETEAAPSDEEVETEAAPSDEEETDASSAGPTVHEIGPDDVGLMDLAREYYDNGFLWPKIWLANFEVLPDPDDWNVGTTLTIPAEAPLTATEQRALELYQAGDLDAVEALLEGDSGDTNGSDEIDAGGDEAGGVGADGGDETDEANEQ